MHEVFYCGTGTSRRFVMYHAPVGSDRGELVVICPPVFTDYARTYLALRELALAVSARGYHVARFDYRGTGDSASELIDITMDDWVADSVAIVAETREITGCTRVSALGVRFGAVLALEAHRRAEPFDRFVFWDPIVSGKDYVSALTRRKSLWLDDYRTWRESVPRPGGPAEIGGYAVSREMAEQISQSTFVVPDALHSRVRIVRTDDPVIGAAPDPSTIPIRFDCKWNSEAEDLMNPRPVLDHLLAELTGARR